MTLQVSAGVFPGEQNDNVKRVQDALQALGRSIPSAERNARTMGPGTVALIRALQNELDLSATGVVDDATVRAINVKLDKRATDKRVVRGSVRDANGDPFTKGSVQIFSQSTNGEQVAGKSPIDAKDGSYQISYQPPPNSNGRADLRVAVLSNAGAIVETTPSGASILTDAGPLEVVDFVLSGEANRPLSEFERVSKDLKQLVGDRKLTDLKEEKGRHEISLLAIRTAHPSEKVASRVLAEKLALEDKKVPAEVFFAWLLGSLPSDRRGLLATAPDILLTTLKTAVEAGVVPKEVGGKRIEDYLAGFAPSVAKEVRPILGSLLNTTELETFAARFLEHRQDPAEFWGKIAADPVFKSRAGKLKLTVQVASLLNVLNDMQAPLVAKVLARPNIKETSDLARLTRSDWESLIRSAGAGVLPDGTPGANAAEKIENYTQQIVSQVEAAFLDAVLARSLKNAPAGNSRVADFLVKQRSFNLLDTYFERFVKSHPGAAQGLTQGDGEELAGLQRVIRVIRAATSTSAKSTVAEETIALTRKGVRSAYQIARMDPNVFAQQHREIFPEERALEVHVAARRIYANALALFSENGSAFNRTGLQALPKLDTGKQKGEAEVENPQGGIPNWETLFGTFDLCACKECSSAHSPAAYFVDILQFLRERKVDETSDASVKDALFARRPDLGEIELSCENTNTVLPYIDLVNEILENAVSPPPPFVPLTLAASLEDDLGEVVATPELTAAFNPPLEPGARVETLEEGKRWRIWDEPFAYSVLKENTTLKVVARSRQTGGSTGERRATPQYRNRAAYEELRRAVYPFNLPFDLASVEANVFLAHLGVSRHDLIEALRTGSGTLSANSPLAVRLAAERLGLTALERKIIVEEPLDPSRSVQDFWGATPVQTLTTVRELLDRSGLSYPQLEELLATWFVNPAGTLTISAKAGEPAATCDTTKLEISGLSENVLGRMHRFIRLWRKLGWTIPELDKAIHAFVPDPKPPVLTNEILVRLDHLRTLMAGLRLTVTQGLAFWRPIDTTEPDSLYHSLFYNPALFKPQDDVFRLKPDGKELARTNTQLAAQDAALQAVFRLSPVGFALLVANTNGRLTLGNLSLLYRHATLSRRLGLSVQDLLTAIELTGIDPFQTGRTQDTLRFVDVVKAIQGSGFSIAELDYLIRHRANREAPFVPRDSGLEQTLTSLRAGLLEVGVEVAAARKKLRESPDAPLLRAGDLKDIANLALRLRHDTDPLSQHLRSQFSPATEQLIQEYDGAFPPPQALQTALTDDLNRLLEGSSLFDEQRFAHVKLTEETRRLIAQNPQGDELTRLNRLLVDEAYSQEAALSQSLVIDRLAEALALQSDVTGALISRVSHGSEGSLNVFLALSEIKDNELPVSRANAKRQFETLEKLLKIAAILHTLKLPGSQLDWLFRETATPAGSWLAAAPDPLATPVPFASWFSLIELTQVRRELALEDAALEAILGACSAVALAPDQERRLAAKRLFIDTLSTWLGWPQSDLETLAGKSDNLADRGLLDVRLPDDYRGLDLILRLQRAMDLLKRLGVTAAQANQWCNDTLRDQDTKAIRHAAKTKQDNQAWLKAVTPLQNSLRDHQREALVSYLVVRPEKWATNTESAEKPDANDVYAHFLIDVEMSSCQLTSRLKLGISSVQLFAQRCLLGLEEGIRTSDGKWRQWEWMKNFRVWEAGRKVWLYPENFIEPELRDDKTPFFKELENELLQTDLDDAAAGQALLRYLEKLGEVARLEIAGVYEDEDKTLHVFGRTPHVPHIYYYRYRKGTTQTWTPWERLDLDIQGDHLIPVVWNRRLMLIWPVFTEKAEERPITMPGQGEQMQSADRYWDVQLAWSEYQHGRWSGSNLSEPVKFKAYQGTDNILFHTPVSPPEFAQKPVGTGGGPDAGNDIGEGDDSGGTVSGNGTSTTTKQLVSTKKIAFKAFAFPEELVVLGYLRRDYRASPVAGDAEIACVFGEFRFFGCRKIITAANHSQAARRNFALAPTGTEFDRMWFTSTDQGLVLFDGQFPVSVKNPIALPLDESPSIVGNAEPTVKNKNNLPVLGRTPSAFRVLAPHQDFQFVSDRPSFFMDARRTFVITSNRSPLRGLTGWVDANVATTFRADFFGQPGPASPGSGTGPGEAASPLVVLAPGPNGRRVSKQLVPVNLQPQSPPQTTIPIFHSLRRHRFINFHHPYVCDFEKALNHRGIAGLLSLETQSKSAAQFAADYSPVLLGVLQPHPIDEVEFQSGGAYEIYNWELFFHIPLLIATRLMENQRFADAQRWFHYIFDPTGASGGSVPQRYWRTQPFFGRLKEGYEAESVKRIEEMIAQGIPEDLKAAVEIWRSDPFSPHAVARLRTTAYQKTVVMKYVDNLIAWGDQLFRRETLESLNEATQLYVLAADILGRQPEVIERNLKPPVQTFNSLDLEPGGLSNPLIQLELLISDVGGSAVAGDSAETPDLPSNTILAFCVPENDRLLGYWNTVADRLFKLRHCMNIEGQIRQLPLFEPPIDPALLVRARAAGLSIGDVLSDLNVSLPNYRFSVMLQKANELAAEVRSLGAGLLSVLEKRDAEALSILRSGQELRLLEAVRDVRVRQIDEAKANIAALEASRQIAQVRKEFYENRESLSRGERESLSGLIISKDLMRSSAALRALVVILQQLGAFKLGAPTTMGPESGPAWIGRGMLTLASAMDVVAGIHSVSSQLTGKKADFGRRDEEWDHQANLATIELKQIEQQSVAAEIRLAVAEQELRNHDLQIGNAREVDRFLRTRFTNQDLYQYMIGRISGLYFQSFQLAYDVAKRSERCMQHELGLKYGETAFIRFGYWDSLKKGLLAGEHLAYDLKRLEIAYLDGNTREYELTKHVSLVSLAPLQFLALKEAGACEFEIPEWLFDLDTPGHYLRRLKMVSVTLPCVTGPYTSVHCKLQLVRNSYRRNTGLVPGYGRDDSNGPDDRFIVDRSVVEAIVTSTGQNDAGLFEPAMRDERYLPFEGTGAISQWRLELPGEFSTFDHDTISDVILHLRYTARDGGGQLRTSATESVKSLLGGSSGEVLFRLFSLRHEFPSEWHRFVSSPPSTTGINAMTVSLAAPRFPYFVQNRAIGITQATVVAKSKVTSPLRFAIVPGQDISQPDLTRNPWPGDGSLDIGNPGPWTFGTDAEPKSVEDVFVIFAFNAG